MNKKSDCILTDYRKYPLKISDFLLSFCTGGVFSAAGMYVMFGSIWVSVTAFFAGTLIFLPFLRKIICKKRQKKLLLQFRDLLDSLGSSFSAGRNLNGAMEDAVHDLGALHGEQSMIAKEAKILHDGLYNSKDFGTMLSDFAERSGLDDIRSFSDTFSAALKSGGNLRETAQDCREIICGRIEVEAEIEAVTASNRNELYIMCATPFAAAAVLRYMGNETVTSNTAVNIAIKLAVLAVFALAFYIGKKLISFSV